MTRVEEGCVMGERGWVCSQCVLARYTPQYVGSSSARQYVSSSSFCAALLLLGRSIHALRDHIHHTPARSRRRSSYSEHTLSQHLDFRLGFDLDVMRESTTLCLDGAYLQTVAGTLKPSLRTPPPHGV